MGTFYNRIAGQSIGRLEALSDGLFAVAMTLLVLDLHAPAAEAIKSEGDLGRALVALLPRLVVYLMSFLTLGIFWLGQQTQLNHFGRSDRNLAWIHLIFLFAVSLMPFSTGLMASFITYRVALLIYWLNILMLGLILICSWRYASRAGLLNEGATAETSRAVYSRIVIAQTLYGLGALLCFINTYCSLGFIIIVQLYYVTAPRLRIFEKWALKPGDGL